MFEQVAAPPRIVPRGMQIALLVSILCCLALGFNLFHAFQNGDFIKETSIILSLPWGMVTIGDIFVGIMLFSMWILHREALSVRAIIWIILIAALGFFIASLYTTLALRASHGNWQHFWSGRRNLHG
jgi:hypothetical protein